MKYLIPLLLLTASCVTSQDLQRVTDSVAELETVLDDPLATQDDVKAAIDEAKEEIGAVKEEVEDRTSGAVDSLGEVGGVAGVVTTVGLLLLNQLRNGTRKKDLADVKEAVKA